MKKSSAKAKSFVRTRDKSLRRLTCNSTEIGGPYTDVLNMKGIFFIVSYKYIYAHTTTTFSRRASHFLALALAFVKL